MVLTQGTNTYGLMVDHQEPPELNMPCHLLITKTNEEKRVIIKLLRTIQIKSLSLRFTMYIINILNSVMLNKILYTTINYVGISLKTVKIKRTFYFETNQMYDFFLILV